MFQNQEPISPAANVLKAAAIPKTFIKRLVTALQPQMIFWRHQHFIIILNGTHTQRHRQYQKIIRSCKLAENASFTLCQQSELELQYRLGNIFLSTFCIPDNCVYAADGSQVESLWQRLVHARDQATEAFQTGIAKARSFYEGACFYWAKGNHPMAAFMLHQATELCLRALIMAFTGQVVRTHVLAELKNHIARFAPEVAGLLCVITVKHQRIFLLLESAYSNARYGDQFQISSKDVQQLLQLVQQLHQAATLHMQAMLGLLYHPPTTVLPERTRTKTMAGKKRVPQLTGPLKKTSTKKRKTK